MDKLQHYPKDSDLYLDHPAQALPGIHPFPDRLHVVTMLENPLRWRSRYQNYQRFEHHVLSSGAILWTVEVALGDRPFEITDPENSHHLQLRTTSEIWHKENALNLIMQRIPRNTTPRTKVAWIDADVSFTRSDWAQETLHLLEHYDVVQMFSQAVYLTKSSDLYTKPTIDSLSQDSEVYPGFVAAWNKAKLPPEDPNYTSIIPVGVASSYRPCGGGGFWGHPGFAWAWVLDVLSDVGMLIDFAILGSADWHMACALVGHVETSLWGGAEIPVFNGMVKYWARRADAIVKGNVGFVPGLLTHWYHGQNLKRSYAQRWDFLAGTGFNPNIDLRRDHQGLWALTDNSRELRDGIRAFMQTRQEDE